MNIYELEKRATPGPWKVRYPPRATYLTRILRSDLECISEHANAVDAVFTAHCRNKFMRALEFLNMLGDAQDADTAHDIIVNHLPELLEELEEVKE